MRSFTKLVYEPRRTFPFSQLLNEVDQSRERDVLIRGPEIHGTFTDGCSFQTYSPSDPSLIQRLYNKGHRSRRGHNLTMRPGSCR